MTEDPSISTDNLSSLNKKQLVELVSSLQKENASLKKFNDFIIEATTKVENLERRLNLHEQYYRRESVEITGISADVPQGALEDKVLEMFDTAKVEVHGRSLRKYDIVACHRIGKKGKTIVRFMNRQFASASLYGGKHLRNSAEFKQTYVNASLCKEFGFLNYQIRTAHKSKKLYRYKVKNGINMVQLEESSDFVEISHRNDLINIGIDIQ